MRPETLAKAHYPVDVRTAQSILQDIRAMHGEPMDTETAAKLRLLARASLRITDYKELASQILEFVTDNPRGRDELFWEFANVPERKLAHELRRLVLSHQLKVDQKIYTRPRA